jgi:hypothetical protein
MSVAFGYDIAISICCEIGDFEKAKLYGIVAKSICEKLKLTNTQLHKKLILKLVFCFQNVNHNINQLINFRLMISC